MKEIPKPQRKLRLLFWESTVRCNLACGYCRRVETNKAAGSDLCTSDAKRLIEQVSRLGEEQSFMPIMVFSGGEPLCRPDLFELAENAHAAGLHCALATNGTLIDSRTAGRINRSGIARVAVSIDGPDAPSHDASRQVQGAFEKAVGGITRLRAAGVPFQINVTVTKGNYGYLPRLYDLGGSLGAAAVHFFMLVPVGCGRLLPESELLTPRQYEQTLLEIFRLESRRELEIKVTCAPHYERIACQHGRSSMRSSNPAGADIMRPSGHGAAGGCLAGRGVLFVGHGGEVFPCGYLPVSCGNCLKKPLASIWFESEILAGLADRRRLGGKCGICDWRWSCGGCRARAYAATGDYMAEEPFCIYAPAASRA